MTTDTGIETTVMNVCFTTRSVRIYVKNAPPEWLPCKRIETHGDFRRFFRQNHQNFLSLVIHTEKTNVFLCKTNYFYSLWKIGSRPSKVQTYPKMSFKISQASREY